MSPKSTLVPFGTGAGAILRLLSAPSNQGERAREPVKPTTGRVVGYFPSAKNNRSIAWESQLEQKACYVFEFSREVLGYREQPLTILYPLGAKILRYTPDFELTLKSGRQVYIEIKPAEKLLVWSIQERLAAIGSYWSQVNADFMVITDEQLNHPILHSNLKLLRGYLKVHCEPELIQMAKHWVAVSQNPTFHGLVTYLNSLNNVYALLAHQHVSINLRADIESTSPLFLSEENHYENWLI